MAIDNWTRDSAYHRARAFKAATLISSIAGTKSMWSEASQMRLRKKEQQAKVTQVLLPSRVINICTPTLGLVIVASRKCIAEFE
jgi:hypothetical protein